MLSSLGKSWKDGDKRRFLDCFLLRIKRGWIESIYGELIKHVGDGIVPQIKDVTGQIKLIKLEWGIGDCDCDCDCGFILEMPLNWVNWVNWVN